MLVSLAFIARRLMADGLDTALFSSPAVVAAVVCIAVLEGAGILAASINFGRLVRNISGVSVDTASVLKAYTMANVYKYIPGSVAYVLGRNRLALENKSLSHGKVLLSTVAEGVLFVAAAALIALVCVFGYSLEYLRQTGLLAPLLYAAVVLPAVALPVVCVLRKRLREGVGRLRASAEILRPRVIAARFGFSLVIVFLWGLSFWATLLIMGHPADPRGALTVIGLYLLAWLAGFLTPGAPSGLGVREAVMLMFLGDIAGETVLLSAIITHRALNIAGDIFALAAALVSVNKYRP